MPVPTLQDVFPGATQTAAAITIPKASLPTLTAAADNNGQQIFVGLILAAAKVLTTAARDADPDKKVEITYDGQTIFSIAGSTNLDRQDTFTTILHKTVSRAEVDSDDY